MPDKQDGRPSDKFLRDCSLLCGMAGCGRVIDTRDSSVYPLRDTGFRVGMRPTRKVTRLGMGAR